MWLGRKSGKAASPDMVDRSVLPLCSVSLWNRLASVQLLIIASGIRVPITNNRYSAITPSVVRLSITLW